MCTAPPLSLGHSPSQCWEEQTQSPDSSLLSQLLPRAGRNKPGAHKVPTSLPLSITRPSSCRKRLEQIGPGWEVQSS